MTKNIIFSNSKNRYINHKDDNLYTDGLIYSLSMLEKYLTPNQKKKLFSDLQLTYNKNNFNEAKYLQAACETTVTASLARMYPNNFKYEDKINPPKDVDCSFIFNGYKFNIEIKCADYSNSHNLANKDGIKLSFLGRHPDKNGVLEDMAHVFGSKDLVESQHMDNKMKDFLLSAHGKFLSTTMKNELNVLIVCCDDEHDMQKWFLYLYGNSGLFQEGSFYPRKEYQNVDVVMLTNIYHRHYEYTKKHCLSSHWDINKAFNLIYHNPFRYRPIYTSKLPYGLYNSEQLYQSQVHYNHCSFNTKIHSFMQSIKNHTLELLDYRMNLDNIPQGDKSYYDVNRRLTHYVHEQLFSNNIYLFEPSKS